MANKVFKIKIDSLNSKGQGVGILEENGKKYSLWNALPNEEVEFKIIKKRKREGVSTSIITPSPDRVTIEEPDHFISCSPWQHMNTQTEEMTKLNVFNQLVNDYRISYKNKIDLLSDNRVYGYRNKMEYSFYGDEQERIHIAFHTRGTSRGKIPIIECKLAEPIINSNTKLIVNWLNTLNIEARNLKSLILRSAGNRDCISALFVKNREFFSNPDIYLDRNLPENFHVYYSEPLSPASKPTELLHSSGNQFLISTILNTKLKFGLNSFFQVNSPIFEETLDDIAEHLEKSSDVVDFYSGVGSISLPLSNKMRHCSLVEINTEAVTFANDNIRSSKIHNCSAVLSKSEDMLNLVNGNSIMILDPPREGIHQNLVDKINSTTPRKLIYLSCNIKTQLEDISKMIDNYIIDFIRLYNYFPRTPHVESLVILSKR